MTYQNEASSKDEVDHLLSPSSTQYDGYFLSLYQDFGLDFFANKIQTLYIGLCERYHDFELAVVVERRIWWLYLPRFK